VVLASLWLASVGAEARAAEDKLRERALALNSVTGDTPLKGEVLTLLGDPGESKKLVAVAVKMAQEKPQPFNFNASYILAQTAWGLKDGDSSEVFLRLCVDQARQLQSGYKLALSLGDLIDVLYDSKKYEESDKICQEFLEIHGDDVVERLKPIVLEQRIHALTKLGKVNEAMKMVDNLIKKDPNDWGARALKGWVLHESDQEQEAAKTYEDVLSRVLQAKDLKEEEQAVYSKRYRFILSNIYTELNEIDKAANHLKALIALDPHSPLFNNNLGYIWADHDMNLEEAEKMIRHAIEEDRKQAKLLNPNDAKENAGYLDSLGWVLFKQKKYKEAKEYLQQAVQDPDEGQHLEIYDHLGDVNMALGEKAEAVAAWKKGVEMAAPDKRDQQKKAQVEKKIKENE
jgi:tetratricopeptide (TPR) repeat protein